MKKSLWLPLAASALLTAGCGTKPDASNTAADDAGSRNTVATTGQTPSAPSDPKEVVRLFLDSMRQGNGMQLSTLLSTLAREEIKRKELEIAPLGSPMATFQIQNAVQEGDGMLVESTWTEPEQGGQPATELEVVWELRKEPAGWRICGMAVDPKNGDEVQIVNFEKLEQDQPAAQDPQRVASLPNATNSLPPSANAPAAQKNQGAFNQQPVDGFPAANNYLPAGNNPSQPVGNTFPAANTAPSGNYGGAPNGFPSNQQTNLPTSQPLSGQPQFPANSGAPSAPSQLPPIVPGNSTLPPAANSQAGPNQFRR